MIGRGSFGAAFHSAQFAAQMFLFFVPPGRWRKLEAPHSQQSEQTRLRLQPGGFAVAALGSGSSRFVLRHRAEKDAYTGSRMFGRHCQAETRTVANPRVRKSGTVPVRVPTQKQTSGGTTFFHSAATCLHLPARLTRESTKREGRKPRTSERHVVGCCE